MHWNRPGLLIVDPESRALGDSGFLSGQFSVATADTLEEGIRYLTQRPQFLAVTELDLPDGDGIELCSLAHTLEHPPLVLVTTSVVHRVPAALRAGCNGVLVKPFSPSLFYTRVRHLAQAMHLYASNLAVTERSYHQRKRATTVIVQPGAAIASTGEHIPHRPCPTCGRSSAVRFDYAAHRRAWYACTECDAVWIADE